MTIRLTCITPAKADWNLANPPTRDCNIIMRFASGIIISRSRSVRRPFDKESSSLNAPSYEHISSPLSFKDNSLSFFSYRKRLLELARLCLIIIINNEARHWAKKEKRYFLLNFFHDGIIKHTILVLNARWQFEGIKPSYLWNTFRERRVRSKERLVEVDRFDFFRMHASKGGVKNGERWMGEREEGVKDRPRWPHGVMTRVWFLKCSRTPCNQEWRGSIRPSSPRRAALDIYNLNLARP